MNIAALTTELTTFLVPFLPFLAKAGEEAAGEVGKTLTAEAWENAKKLWVKLWVKVKDRPAAQEAVQDVAKDPQDKDAQAALRNQLKKLLCEDQDLANEIDGLMKSDVVQRVLADENSRISGVAQSAAGSGGTKQVVEAGGGSIIENVNQFKR